MHSLICVPSKAVVSAFSKEAIVRKKRSAKLVHECEYVADVEMNSSAQMMVGHRICRWVMPRSWIMCGTQ